MLYLDSSALVKLVVYEQESTALRQHLSMQVDSFVCSSALATVEVIRAVKPQGADAVDAAHVLLEATQIVELGFDILTSAAGLAPNTLRTLDAIHIATALALGTELDAVITYDKRMADAAKAAGLMVLSPS